MPSTHQMIISAILAAFAPMAAAQEVDGPVPTPLQILLCPETDPLCDPLDTADPGKGPVSLGDVAGSGAPEFQSFSGGGFVPGAGGAPAITQPDYFKQFDAESAGSGLLQGHPFGSGFPYLSGGGAN